MEVKVFDRIEKKYLITKEQKKRLLRDIRKNLKKDTYFKSEVHNIYFDNDNYDTIINSIDWVDFKAKIRARNYQGYDRVFLEIKTKIHGSEENIGYKRRIRISLEDYERFSRGESTLEELLREKDSDKASLQIAKEIDYLAKLYDLSPKILVYYNRESYKDETGFRVTFDEKLRYREQNLSFIPAKDDKMYLENKHKNIIMEVKARGVFPLWFTKLLTEQKIYPERFSKIGNIYQKIYQKGHNV